MKGYLRKAFIAGAGIVGTYIIARTVAYKRDEDEFLGEGNLHLRKCFPVKRSVGIYEGKIKPALDQILSFSGLVVLFPVFAVISAVIWIDDPGSIIFTQKRIGKNKTYFMCHKFRSMRMDTPHDVPTHQLTNPENYITRVGAVLRKTSLDELPQIWDIFRGKMSVIGPRPALWNQEDLMFERDKYGANDIMPGLTGLAQIKGRDELKIPEKAKLDGEYTNVLQSGGIKALKMDIKCFLGTVKSVIKYDGVVEGGTGCIGKFHNLSVNEVYATSNPPVRAHAEFSNSPIKVLIVGAGSYIGTSLEQWLACCYKRDYEITTFNIRTLTPTVAAFSSFDVVFHVAGIAHRKESAHFYYEVNTDLAVEVAEMAKRAGVGHLIILSSMSVYGMETGVITKDTRTRPQSNYGKSKLQADEKIWELRDEQFRVAILRPPMVYGKGCKGNYQRLKKFTLMTPVFPKVANERSMIYIGNLCSFVQDVIDRQREGIFFPQNGEYVNVSDMVEKIALMNGKKVRLTKIFNWAIMAGKLRLVKKLFGDLTYEKVDQVNKYSFNESIKLTEE